MYAFPVRLLAAIREVPGWSAILYPVREYGVPASSCACLAERGISTNNISSSMHWPHLI